MSTCPVNLPSATVPQQRLSLSLLLQWGLLALLLTVCHARYVSPLPVGVFSIADFRGKPSTTLYFSVQGTVTGSVYGTGVYTDDSSIAAAAVHAGLVAPGKTAVVRLTTLPGQASYSGSTSNGITSNSYSQYTGSYSLAADDGGDSPVLTAPTNLSSWRSRMGGVFFFKVTANAKAGSVWGTNVYTHDTALAAAVVHAGVLRDGETGTVRVTISPAQTSFVGSTLNGLTSNSFGAYDGSYTVSNASGTTPLAAYPGMPTNPLAASVGLGSYVNQIGAALYFRVTGSTSGVIWGTGVYTGDSSLATAAVHAGKLGAASTDVVKVSMLGPQTSFASSVANGVRSNSFGAYSTSFRVDTPDSGLGNMPQINSALLVSGKEGSALSYTVTASPAATKFNATGLPEGLVFDSASATITGTPLISGRFRINLLATNDAGTTSAELVLNISASGVITLSPTGPYDFGSVTSGRSAQAIITLTNSRSSAVLISGISGLNAPFSADENCPTYLKPGASCNITLTYAPSDDDVSVGTSLGRLTVNASANVLGSPFIVVGSAKAGVATLVPDTFSFSNVDGVNLSSVVQSNAITVSGITRAVAMTVANGQYSKNGAAYTGQVGLVRPGDIVRVRLLSSAKYADPVTATLTIGGISAAFTASTLAKPFLVPDGRIKSSSLVVKSRGSKTAQSLDVEVKLDDIVPTSANTFADAASYKLFVAAFLPGGIISPAPETQVFLKDISSNWVGVGSPLAAYMENVLVNSQDTAVKLDILADFDFGLISGTEFYLG